MFLGNCSSVPLRLPSLFLLCSLPDASPPLLPALCSTPAASAPHCTEPYALPYLATAFPTPRWPPLLSPRCVAVARATTSSRRRASSCSRAATSSFIPRAHPGVPSTLALAFAHTHFAHSLLLRPPHFTGPPPRLRLTVDSRHSCSPSLIQSTNSTPATHRSSLSKPIPISSTGIDGPRRRRAPVPPPARPRRRPAVAEPLHPCQGHQQHHTNL
jgi:hypothetical protein